MSSLLDDLRAGGRHHSFGTFSLDRKKALEKMREFQLVDPHEYVLQMVAAGVAGGASRIDVTLEGHDVTLRLHGLSVPRDLMAQPLGGLFIGKERTELDAWRHFSISLNALFALRPREVLVQSGDEAVRVDAQGGVTSLGAHDGLPDTRIHVIGRWTWRHLLRVFGVGSEEEKLLRERASWAPIPISVNGSELSKADWKASAEARARLEGAVLSQAFEDAGTRALLWLDERADPISTRDYVRHGIRVTTVASALPPLQPDAVVYADALVTNASESGILEDERLHAVERFLVRASLNMVERACEVYTTGADARPWLRSRLLQAAAWLRAEGRPWEDPTLDAVARLPLFTDLKNAPMSLATLRDIVLVDGVLRWTDLSLSGRLPQKHRVVKVRDEADAAALADIFEGRVRPFADARDLVLRNLNLTRWRVMPRRLHVPLERCPVSVAIDEDGFVGELGLPLDASQDRQGLREITFLAGGRPLCSRSMPDGALRYVALLDHDDLSINLRWDDVEEEEVFARGLAVLERAHERACRRLAEMVGAAPQPAGERMLAEHALRFLQRFRKVEGVAPPGWVTSLRIVPTVSGALCSLAELEAEAAARDRLVYVHDIAGEQMESRLVVNLQKGDRLLDLPLLRRLVPVKWIDHTRRLESERLTLRLQSRPECKPVLSDAALFPTPFKNREIFGVVGLALGSGPSAVTLIRKARRLEVRSMFLGPDPLEVAIDSPFLQGDAEGARVRPGPALDRVTQVVDEACVGLARAVAAAWPGATGAARDRMRRFLLAWIERHHAALTGEVEACALFRDLAGRPVSLAEVRASVRERGHVRCVPADLGTLTADALTLAVDEDEEWVLRKAFESVRDVSDELRREQARRGYLARPVVPRTLPAGSWLFQRGFAEEGVEGVLGVHPLGEEERRAAIHVLHEERLLCILRPAFALPVTAVVWSPAIAPGAGYALPPEQAAPIERAVHEALAKAVRAFSVDDGAPPDLRARVAVAWCLRAVSSPPDLLRQAVWSVLGRLSSAPVLQTSEGQPATLADVVRQSLERGFVRWVEPEVEGQPLDGVPAFRLDEEMQVLLRPHFAEMQCYSARMQKDEARRAEMDRTRTVEHIAIRTRGPFVWRMPVDAKGLRGEVGVAEGGDTSGIELVIGNLVHDTFDPCPGLHVVGMLAADFRPARGGRGVLLSTEQRDAIHGIVDELFSHLAASAEHHPRLHGWYLANRAQWLEGNHLEDPSIAVALFPVAGGRTVSLRDLMWSVRTHRVLLTSSSPMSTPRDECVVVCRAGDPLHRFLEQFFGVWALKPLDQVPPSLFAPPSDGGSALARPSAAPPSPPPPAVAGAAEASGAVPALPAVAGPAAAPAAVPTPAAPPAPRSPREAARALLRGVVAAFRAMALKQQYDWKVEVFGRVGTVAARHRRELVYLDGTLCFNLEHPLAERLLGDPTSPDHVALVASALFSVYNQAQEDVTDDDEVRFMAELLLWHAQAASARV